LLSKSELGDAVWPDTAVEEDDLDKSIHATRNAQGEKTREHKFIETIRKHGYRFVADVRVIDKGSTPPEPENVHKAETGAERLEVPEEPAAELEHGTNSPPQTAPASFYRPAAAAAETLNLVHPIGKKVLTCPAKGNIFNLITIFRKPLCSEILTTTT
jgi:DNA-binding winged helix-turn-helix (wHTH) protein